MQDIIIIGGGPAGLSAAINAAAEGLETLVIADKIGGQAGTSSRIENQIGFPEGVSGPNLTERCCDQARRLGAMITKGHVNAITKLGNRFALHLHGGSLAYARAIILACGVKYVEPSWAKSVVSKTRIHYAATPEVGRHIGRQVIVVGGGNSAGQAAEYMSGHCDEVTIVVRGHALSETMSSYLRERLLANPKVSVRYDTEVVQRTEDAVILKDGTELPADDIFIMIGAKPNCTFAGVELDDHGFVETDQAYQTDIPGIYAVGDIRSGSVKRVASSSGEGAACIQHVYKWINQ